MLLDDERLIAACLRGQTEAFDELARRYQGRLYNALYRFLNSAEDALDVAQEAFLSAYVSLVDFKGGARFYTWLYRIAMNHAIDLRRRQRNVLSLSGPTNEFPHPQDRSAASRPEDVAAQKESHAVLHKALARLSSEHRMALVLKDIEGMKYEEMAEVLEVPIGTVRSRLHRARLELRAVLEQMETAPPAEAPADEAVPKGSEKGRGSGR